MGRKGEKKVRVVGIYTRRERERKTTHSLKGKPGKSETESSFHFRFSYFLPSAYFLYPIYTIYLVDLRVECTLYIHGALELESRSQIEREGFKGEEKFLNFLYFLYNFPSFFYLDQEHARIWVVETK